MKLDTVKSFTQETTVRGEEIAMTVESGAMAHIMGILTNMYEDPEAASIREPAVNALDSHIEAGQSRPIEVTTPTALRPVFTVQDWGVGLSPRDVRDIYSRYGASTKRDTNEQTGGLGIGCKAPLSYCDQFTLRAVKDGEAIHVQIGRDENGGGTMTVIEAGATDEPNGVLVSIPARRENELADKAAELFRYWTPGTVLLNGTQPPSVWDEGADHVRITDDIVVVRTDTRHHVQRGVIVQGGVPYETEFADMSRLANDTVVVARVPIGSAHFAPSRESLMDTATTQATLREIATKVNREKGRVTQRLVNAATTRGEALAAYSRSCELLNHWPKGVHWRDAGELPAEIQMPAHLDGDARYWYIRAHGNRSWRGARSEHTRMKALGLKAAGGSTWLLGFTNRTWTKTMRDKLDAYAASVWGEQNPGVLSYVATAATELPSDWLRGARAVQWSDVKAWRDPDAPKVARSGGGVKYAGTYPAYDATGQDHTQYPAGEIAQAIKGGALVFHTDWLNQSRWNTLHTGFKGKSVLLVKVTSTREAKFKRTFPAARPMNEGIEAARKAWADALTETERERIAYERADGSRLVANALHALNPDELDDPALAKAARVLGRALPHGYTEFGAAVTSPAVKLPSVAKVYPLLGMRPGYHTNASDRTVTLHRTIYANAVFAATKKRG